MSYVKNWLHCVWGTKNRLPFLTKEINQDILDHIKGNALNKNIYIDIINGHSEHIHCLLSLNADQSLSNVMQLLKGESSYWINRKKLTKFKFEWAVEYFAVSVSESHIPNIRQYIKNQEEHHRKKTWEEEYNIFLAEYGFNRFQG
jgi:putative transposase